MITRKFKLVGLIALCGVVPGIVNILTPSKGDVDVQHVNVKVAVSENSKGGSEKAEQADDDNSSDEGVPLETLVLPDPEWPAGSRDWYIHRSVPADPAPTSSAKFKQSTEWRGVPVPPPESRNVTGIYYFYDDIANHSVYLLQHTLRLVEPTVPQVSLYVKPEMKTFGWSYPVKLNFIMSIIKANWNKVVVVIDTDLVFYRPWVHLVEKAMLGHDVAFQGVDSYDPTIKKEFTKRRKALVFSVAAIRCNAASLKLFEAVYNKITCNGRWIKGSLDQEELLNEISKHPNLRWTVLPRDFWGPSLSRSRCLMPTQPVMCHPDKKKADQGGQWLPWHRKTEWKLHHILSQHCMGRTLIPTKDKGAWWHPYSLLTELSTLTTPYPAPVDPNAQVFIYSKFLPDDWSRFVCQLTLRATEPTLLSQFTNGSFTPEHAHHILAQRPVNSITYFIASTTSFFKPFHSFVAARLERTPIVHVGDTGFIAVKKVTSATPDLSALRPPGRLPPKLFHLTSNRHPSAGILLCSSNRLLPAPHWKTKRGVQGYLTLDEQHFYTHAYLQCGKHYSDSYHTLDYWTAPGEAVDTCKGRHR